MALRRPMTGSLQGTMTRSRVRVKVKVKVRVEKYVKLFHTL